MQKNLFSRVSGMLCVAAAAASLAACGGGGSVIDGSVGNSNQEVVVVAGSTVDIPGTMKTETNLLTSMNWVITPADTAVVLTNQDCAAVTKNDTKFVPPTGYTGTRTGASSWSCSLNVKTASEKDVFKDKVYNLSLTGTDDLKQSQTATTSLRVKPYFSTVEGFSAFNFKQPANLADLQGSWVNGSINSNLPDAVANDANIQVNADGTFTGVSKGCTWSGTATPNGTENFFTTTVTFGAAPCLLPNTTMTGVSIGFTNGTTKNMIGFVQDAAKENWMSFVTKR